MYFDIFLSSVEKVLTAYSCCVLMLRAQIMGLCVLGSCDCFAYHHGYILCEVIIILGDRVYPIYYNYTQGKKLTTGVYRGKNRPNCTSSLSMG